MKGLWIGIAALLGALVVTAPALAHPKLVKAQPAKGAILKKAPTKVQLWFHEELDTKLSTFTVLNQKNERVNSGDAKVNVDDRKIIEFQRDVGNYCNFRHTACHWLAARSPRVAAAYTA